MVNQSKLKNDGTDSESVNLCIICHQQLESEGEGSSTHTVETQNFILKNIFLFSDTVYHRVTERITQAKIKRNVLFQLCNQCDFHLTIINGTLSQTNPNNQTIALIVQRLQKQKRDALSSLLESSNITTEEMDLLRRVEHLEKGMVQVESEVASKSDLKRGRRDKIKGLSMPLSVKKAKLESLEENKSATDAVENSSEGVMPPPQLKTASFSYKKKTREDVGYKYTGSEIYGDMRKSERPKRPINYQEDDQESMLSLPSSPSSPVAKKKELIFNSVKLTATVPNQEKASAQNWKLKVSDWKETSSSSSPYSEDLSVYGSRILNWARLTELDQASPSLLKKLKKCPGKYIKDKNKEPGQLYKKQSAHRCRLCSNQYSHECYLLYHIDRVHFGTSQPCKCPSCGFQCISLKRGVQHAKICLNEKPTDKVNGWTSGDESEESEANGGAAPLPIINTNHTCFICRKSFQSTEEVDAHLVEKHPWPLRSEPEDEPSVKRRSPEIANEEENEQQERDSGNGSVISGQLEQENENLAGKRMENLNEKIEKSVIKFEIDEEKIEVDHERKQVDNKMMGVNGVEKYICILCKAGFRNPVVLQYHNITQHNCPDLENQFPVCDKCNAVCLGEESLLLHMGIFHP